MTRKDLEKFTEIVENYSLSYNKDNWESTYFELMNKHHELKEIVHLLWHLVMDMEISENRAMELIIGFIEQKYRKL